ncbi:MAG: VCBS repeat-containing protein [Lewinellaceae bacterium]|nr:VCBS repeat-containing protein [Phaeodactylibacter sp.]MCB9038825.1 VCBS repeat-containing protein [Lewinellaceae bacterium]
MTSKLIRLTLGLAGIGALAFFIAGCSGKEAGQYQFQLLRKDATGLDFQNELRQTADFNALNYAYFYNGGGIAAGDFNQDGRVDLFLTNNMGPNKLFLNEGNLRFRDVTGPARLEGMGGWTSGASVVDINNDGLLDIYVSQLGDYQGIKGKNQLYICLGIENGVPAFEDQAPEYGLDLVGFSTQAAFFDYDLDGDLDMYQLNHSLHQNGTFGEKFNFDGTQHPLAGDKLMRNDGGRFTDVTLKAGILSTVVGYGLGLATGDVDLDGWPDIYIGNDFHENDYLYINQKDGTFKEMLNDQMMHTSRFSMGVDMADINNDGFDEVISLDMAPDDPVILKSSQGENAYDVYSFKLRFGYNHQYARNNLQLNQGNNTFSEIALFSGVYATDWSWSPLFMDFDLDGYKDLFISNGIPRRFNDLDYIKFRANSEVRFKANTNNLEDSDLVVVDRMPQIKLPNRFFRNTAALKFEDIGNLVRDNLPSYSNGAIYADLDNDGDLDIVTNNIEDEPFVYQNLAADHREANRNYLHLSLKGPVQNIRAIGARAIVFKGEQRLISEHFPVRGFQSSADNGIHLGIGDTAEVDSLLLIWPDQTYQKLDIPAYNRTLALEWQPGLPKFDFRTLGRPWKEDWGVKDVTDEVALDFRHKESPYIDFNREYLIPHMVSTEGPALAVGDVNGDGLEDVFLGGAKRLKSRIYYQSADGKFYENTPAAILSDSLFEDVDAVFADLENDGDLDLIVASGGNEFWDQHEALKQRAYINDGKGNFQGNKSLFGGAYLTASCVLPADFNGDGLVDFFFGGRAVPWKYGLIPDSYLFLNKGNGQFEDVTETDARGLRKAGLVKNGAWADLDQDGDADLLLALEWGAIQLFINNDGKLEQQPLNDMKGWWNFILPYDFDQDGDMDLLAGNLGENSKLQPTPEEPVRMYVNDFDNNGQIEQVLTYYLKGREIPFANYEEITKQMVSLKKKYLFARDFARATLPEIFGADRLADSEVLEVNNLKSMYFENTGKGLAFKAHALPDELQFSSLRAASLYDFDQDGTVDVLLGGNFYENNIEMGRYDANFGNVLSIGADGGFRVSALGSLLIKGQVRRIRPVRIGGKVCFILARNDDTVIVIQPAPADEDLL